MSLQGSEAEINGVYPRLLMCNLSFRLCAHLASCHVGQRPDKWFPYDGAYPYTDRVQTVLDWLDMPDSEGPDLILTYFEDVDHAGHSYVALAALIIKCCPHF